MTREEARNKACWEKIDNSIRQKIISAVNVGEFKINIKQTDFSIQDIWESQDYLRKLGYTVTSLELKDYITIKWD